MRRIGKSQSGTVVVEMSEIEWRNCETALADPEEKQATWWERDFVGRLDLLKLKWRTYRRLRGAAWRASAMFRQNDTRNATVELFLHEEGNRMLTFDEWVRAVHERKNRLMRCSGIGKVTVNEILSAVDSYLASK